MSYLSPHVNTASRLEAATKYYGVAILLSESVFVLLSSEVQERCRCETRGGDGPDGWGGELRREERSSEPASGGQPPQRAGAPTRGAHGPCVAPGLPLEDQ